MCRSRRQAADPAKVVVQTRGGPRSTSRDAQVLEHVPEKWKPVFRKRTCDRARIKGTGRISLCPCASSRRGKCRRDIQTRSAVRNRNAWPGATLRSPRACGPRQRADTASRAKTAADRRRTASISLGSRSSSAPMRGAARLLRGRRENPSTGGTSASRISGAPAPAAAIRLDRHRPAPEYSRRRARRDDARA